MINNFLGDCGLKSLPSLLGGDKYVLPMTSSGEKDFENLGFGSLGLSEDDQEGSLTISIGSSVFSPPSGSNCGFFSSSLSADLTVDL